jgi:hypothetical protein
LQALAADGYASLNSVMYSTSNRHVGTE